MVGTKISDKFRVCTSVCIQNSWFFSRQTLFGNRYNITNTPYAGQGMVRERMNGDFKKLYISHLKWTFGATCVSELIMSRSRLFIDIFTIINNFASISILISGFLTNFYHCQHCNHWLSITCSWFMVISIICTTAQILNTIVNFLMERHEFCGRPATLIVFIVNCFIFTIIVHILISRMLSSPW